MAQRRETWRETFVALGEALIEVLRAEVAVITEAWAKTGRHLAIALAMLAGAGYVTLVLLPPLLIFAAVFGLHEGLDWPLWGSALTVAGGVLLVVGLVAGLAVRHVQKRCENPATVVRDRVVDHKDWWNNHLFKDMEGNHNSAGGSDGDDVASEERRNDDVAGRSAGEESARS